MWTLGAGTGPVRPEAGRLSGGCGQPSGETSHPTPVRFLVLQEAKVCGGCRTAHPPCQDEMWGGGALAHLFTDRESKAQGLPKVIEQARNGAGALSPPPHLPAETCTVPPAHWSQGEKRREGDAKGSRTFRLRSGRQQKLMRSLQDTALREEAFEWLQREEGTTEWSRTHTAPLCERRGERLFAVVRSIYGLAVGKRQSTRSQYRPDARALLSSC